MPPPLKNPAPSRVRLDGLDLARYLAFVGMVVVNFKVVMGAENGSTILHHLTAAIEGRAAATFVTLAGIGLGLAAAKNIHHTIPTTIKRAIFLLALGLANTLIFPADIIHYYAFYFLFGVCLLTQTSRALLTTIAALNIAFVAMLLTLDYDAGWDWATYAYADFWTPSGFARNLFFNGWHPVIPWLSFLLFGVALSRLSLTNRKTQRWLALGGACVLTASEGIRHLLTPALAAIHPELAALATTQPIPPAPLYILAGMGTSCLVVATCLILTDLPSFRGTLQAFIPAGRQTLTLYMAHIVIGIGSLEALGLLDAASADLPTDQTILVATSAALLFCVVATIYAWLWSRYFRRGPVEALMRALAG